MSPRRPAPSLSDSVLSGVVVSLVLLTLFGFGETVGDAFSTAPARPGEPARRLSVEIDDRNSHERINVRIPAGLVENFANLVDSDATIRFEDEIADAQVDFLQLWSGVKGLPEGETWSAEMHGNQVSAKRRGDLVEVTVKKPAGDSPAADGATPPDAPTAPAAPTPPAPPRPGGSSAEIDIATGEGDGSLRIEVSDSGVELSRGDGPETVTFVLPARIFEEMEKAGGMSVRLDLAELVRDLRRQGPVEILRVESEGESVRIALD